MIRRNIKLSRVLRSIGLVSLLFVFTGCFQQMSDETINPTPASNLFASPTPEPPTWTPQPTFTPFPTLDGSPQVVVVTPTSDPLQPIPTATATVQSVDALSVDAQSGEEVAQIATETISPALQEATRIIGEATQRAVDATETARGPVIPTATPTVFGQQPPAVQPTQTPGVVAPGGSCTYTTQRGDNLFQISLQYDVPIEDIARASGITNVQIISVGQEIIIPNCTVSNTGSFQQQGGTTTTTTGTTAVNCNSGITHTVAQYETLFEISQRYNVSLDALAQCNGISNYNFILYTQELVIPAGG